MEDVITWILIVILCFTAVGISLSFIIYANIFVLNLFYHLFTGKDLKIYEKISSCFKDF
jgi:hypothetical protein